MAICARSLRRNPSLSKWASIVYAVALSDEGDCFCPFDPPCRPYDEESGDDR